MNVMLGDNYVEKVLRTLDSQDVIVRRRRHEGDVSVKVRCCEEKQEVKDVMQAEGGGSQREGVWGREAQ